MCLAGVQVMPAASRLTMLILACSALLREGPDRGDALLRAV